MDRTPCFDSKIILPLDAPERVPYHPKVDNPLRKLTDQLGLTPEFIARQTGLRLQRAEKALQNIVAGGALADWLLIMRCLGVKMRLHAVDPIRIWIDTAAIDRLITDNQWRRQQDICPCPRNTSDLRATVRTLASRMSQAEAAAYLERHMVPSGHGLLKWDQSAISKWLTRDRETPKWDRKTRRLPALLRREQFRRRWREFVVALYLQKCFPADPIASLRYRLVPEYTERHVHIVAKERMPECVAEWMKDTLKRLSWFGGHEWGVGDPL